MQVVPSAPNLTVSSSRAAAALAIAVFADLIQLPINALFFTGFLAVPSEIADLVVDTAAAVLITALLGFHWALLPSFVAELFPGLDLIPTWTGCVALVVWQRRREHATSVVSTNNETAGAAGEMPSAAGACFILSHSFPLLLDVPAPKGRSDADSSDALSVLWNESHSSTIDQDGGQ
jgi:type III secretory pathway component EscV